MYSTPINLAGLVGASYIRHCLTYCLIVSGCSIVNGKCLHQRSSEYSSGWIRPSDWDQKHIHERHWDGHRWPSMVRNSASLLPLSQVRRLWSSWVGQLLNEWSLKPSWCAGRTQRSFFNYWIQLKLAKSWREKTMNGKGKDFKPHWWLGLDKRDDVIAMIRMIICMTSRMHWKILFDIFGFIAMGFTSWSLTF